MATGILMDSALDDDARRARVHAGQLFVYGVRPAVLAFARYTQAMVADAFAGLDPLRAQYELPVDDYAQILGRLKPAFIHAPESRAHVVAILEEYGCDPDETYYDLPRLRSSTSDNYLTSGIAYAWHPHRDTWYSAPPSQINWWMPVHALDTNNTVAFHPAYWNAPVANDSEKYNYFLWNQQHRGEAVTKIRGPDPRPLPRPTETVALEPQIRPVPPVGGMLIFSGAQLHSSVPNDSGVTRYSIDFRIVNRRDALEGIGAPHSDEKCTGTSIRDFRRARDGAAIPDDVVARYDDGSQREGVLVYGASAAPGAPA